MGLLGSTSPLRGSGPRHPYLHGLLLPDTSLTRAGLFTGERRSRKLVYAANSKPIPYSIPDMHWPVSGINSREGARNHRLSRPRPECEGQQSTSFLSRSLVKAQNILINGINFTLRCGKEATRETVPSSRWTNQANSPESKSHTEWEKEKQI